jgi:hypothetical protein
LPALAAIEQSEGGNDVLVSSSLKKNRHSWVGGMAQDVECLPSKHEAPSSNPTNTHTHTHTHSLSLSLSLSLSHTLTLTLVFCVFVISCKTAGIKAFVLFMFLGLA